MVGIQLLLSRTSFLVLLGGWLLGLHHTANAFQPPRNCPRQTISLQARKHILYTQQHAYDRISNGTTALLNSNEVPSSSSDDDDDESSLQMKFQEHIQNMLNVESHQKVLMAYDELLTMSKMYKKTKQRPPRHWNTRSERIIKLRGVFEIDKEETSSDVGTGELRWKGSVVQPDNKAFEEVANALISPIVFRRIGGWEVCRLLEQMLAQVDRQSGDGGGDVEAVKECINANLIEALSKVGDGPSARQIVYREKIARVQKQKEAEREMIKKEIRPPRRKLLKNGVFAAVAARDSPVATTEGQIDESRMPADQHDNDTRSSELNSVRGEEIVVHRHEPEDEEEQQQQVGESAKAADDAKSISLASVATGDDTTKDYGDDKIDEVPPQEVLPRASNALTYAKKIHNCYSDSQHDKQAAPKSLQLLKQMVNSLEERPHQLEPDMWIFNTVLLIWARSGRADSGQVAEEILDMMKLFGRNRSPSEFPYPNDQSYTFVIDAYANSGQKNSGQKALEILHQLNESDWQPNARSLSTTIEAIFKAGDPIPLHLLKQMIDLNQSGDDSSIINSRTFTKAIVRGDAKNALQVLDLLNDIGESDIGPNVVHYNAAIFCLAKSDLPNRAEIATKLLRRMNKGGIEGNVVTYTAVLTAQDTYEEAERWMWRMEDKYGIAPTTRTYNSCLHVLLNSDAEDTTDRAFALLSRMEKRHLKGSTDKKPDLVTYTTIANILRKHGSKEVATVRRQADWLLSRVRQMGFEPDDVFNTAINQLRVGK
ncbi:pentatricopeptide repeat-containing protein [Skeletonema marinoi]|uniref:Pentatricopeptide repeat-containing protein n=1 Tax=Skeletonema marinoi TaxID=267567 RepID=A0AAD9D5T4_9STRA|nr:pentatricopeptide repeat-containing protein [Skeletonema marinoi]